MHTTDQLMRLITWALSFALLVVSINAVRLSSHTSKPRLQAALFQR
jgi:hypothetical protein